MAYKYEKVDQKLLVPQIEDQLMIYVASGADGKRRQTAK